MESLLPLSSEPLEVRWENSQAEIRLLKTLGDRHVTLVVPHLQAMERAASTLGLRIPVGRNLLYKGMADLNGRETQWREFTTQNGAGLSRSVVMRVTGNC